MKKLRFKGATYNPLNGIKRDSPTAMDESKRIANALVIRTGNEMQPHFPDVAEEVIWGLTAATVNYGEPEDRSLGTVDQIVTNPQRLDKIIELMMKSTAWNGTLAALGGRMKLQAGDEKASTFSTVSRFMSWSRTPLMLANIATSSFDPLKLKRKKMMVYIVLPPEHIKAQAGWLRVMVNSMIMAGVHGGPDESRKIWYVLDEAASLGTPPPESVADLVTGYRKYGCRGIFVYQGLGQLGQCWPKDQGQTLMANTAQIFLSGARDIQTANTLSSMLGKATLLVESWGDGENSSSNDGWSEGAHNSSRSGGRSRGRSSNRNLQQIPRELAKPEELLTFPSRWAITFPPDGVPPVLTYTLRYWEEKWLFQRSSGLVSRFRQACRTLVGSLVLFAIGLVLAMALTQMAVEQSQRAPAYPARVLPRSRGF